MFGRTALLVAYYINAGGETHIKGVKYAILPYKVLETCWTWLILGFVMQKMLFRWHKDHGAASGCLLKPRNGVWKQYLSWRVRGEGKERGVDFYDGARFEESLDSFKWNSTRNQQFAFGTSLVCISTVVQIVRRICLQVLWSDALN